MASCETLSTRPCLWCRQFVEQRLGLPQVERIEAFGEPVVDRSEKFASLLPPALTAPEPCHAHRRAQFPGLCLLLTRNRQRVLEIRFRFRRIRLWRQQRDLPGHAMDLGLPLSVFACFHCCDRFTNATPGVIELAKL